MGRQAESQVRPAAQKYVGRGYRRPLSIPTAQVGRGRGHTSAPVPPMPRVSVQPPFRASGHSEWAVGPVEAIREHKAEGLAARDVAGEASPGTCITKALPAPLALPGARLCNVLMPQVAPTQPSENSAYTQEMGLRRVPSWPNRHGHIRTHTPLSKGKQGLALASVTPEVFIEHMLCRRHPSKC